MRNGVYTPERNSADTRYQQEKWLYDQLTSRRTLKEIAEMCGVTEGAVLRFQRKFGFQKKFIGGYSQYKTLDLCPAQQQIIEGCLLGDGHIVRPQHKRSASYQSSVSSTNPEVPRAISMLLLGYDKSSSRTPSNGRDNIRYELQVGATNFFSERLRWYPAGIKSVPRDFLLTPLSLRWWHIGDGSVSRTPRQNRVYLCTDAFSRRDNNALVKQLELLDSKATLPNGGRNRIFIAAKSFATYFETIGEPLPGYEHRWL